MQRSRESTPSLDELTREYITSRKVFNDRVQRMQEATDELRAKQRSAYADVQAREAAALSSIFPKRRIQIDNPPVTQYLPEVVKPVPAQPIQTEFQPGLTAGAEGIIADLARKYGLPVNVFTAMIGKESRFNPNAVSPKGATGLAQLMPGTARDLGVDIHDPMSNLEGGARYLRQQLDRFGSMPLALAAYNAGPGAVQKYGGIPPYKETQRYVRDVLHNAGEEGYADGGVVDLAEKYGEGYAYGGRADATGVSRADFLKSRRPSVDDLARFRDQALSVNPTEGGSTLEDYVQKRTGMDPQAKRKAILPWVDETGVVAPQWLYEAVKAYEAPGAAYQGVPMTPEDAANFAATFATEGLGASHIAGPTDQNIIGMAVKQRGGNWLKDYGAGIDTFIDRIKLHIPKGQYVDPVLDAVRERGSVNDWLNTKLKKYLFNDLATPEDPLRVLAEDGKLHYTPATVHEDSPVAITNREARAYLGFPEDGYAINQAGKNWEHKADYNIDGYRSVGDIINIANEFDKSDIGKFITDLLEKDNGAGYSYTKMLQDNPWLMKVPPKTRVNDFAGSYQQAQTADLGFPHLRDELLNAIRPDSDLPEQLRLTPEKLQKVSVPQASELVGKINAWRAEQKVAANMQKARNPATFVRKEYPEAGLQWVELKMPDSLPEGEFLPADGHISARFRLPTGEEEAFGHMRPTTKEDLTRAYGLKALNEALDYEGKTMGHCAGGKKYGTDVERGQCRIFSLRDAKGAPHVTIETRSYPKPEYTDAYNAEIDRLIAEGADRKLSDIYKQATKNLEEKGVYEPTFIAQIRGKQNAKPNEKYTPFVQDFVKSRDWGHVVDLANADLYDRNRILEYIPRSFEASRNARQIAHDRAMIANELPKYTTRDEWEAILKKHLPEDTWLTDADKKPEFAQGGLVGLEQKYADGGFVDEIAKLGRKAQYALSDLAGIGPEVQFATETPPLYFPKTEQHNGRGDAMRHLLFQAEIAQKYGEGPAQVIGWVHENLSGPQGEAEKAMDVYNDELGRKIGKTAKSRSDIVRRALQEIENGSARDLSEDQMPQGYACGGAMSLQELHRKYRKAS